MLNNFFQLKKIVNNIGGNRMDIGSLRNSLTQLAAVYINWEKSYFPFSFHIRFVLSEFSSTYIMSFSFERMSNHPLSVSRPWRNYY